MDTGLIILLVLGGIILLIGGFLWATYNSLVTLKIRVDEAWSGITVQLKRRADLLPNLIETVRGFAKHEAEVFTKVTEARNATINAQGPAEAGRAEGELQGALKSLFAVAEAYPQLTSNQNFLHLQGELVDTEDKISASRRFYNGGVRDLNTKIKVFPNNVFAGMLGFTEREFFEVADAGSIQAPPTVQF